MSEIHAGYIHDGGVYNLKTLEEIYNKNERCLTKWLDRLGVPWNDGPDGGRVYTGFSIRLGMEARASCGGTITTGTAGKSAG